MNIADLKGIIEVAQNQRPADLILKNAGIVDIFSHRIIKAGVAVHNGFIAGIGSYKKARKIIDLKNAYLAPSFIDGHIHIESSLLCPFEFAKTVIPHGTGTCVIDPHEIANCLGVEGINFMLSNAAGLPIDIYCMLPSCVPATSFETAGADLKAKDLKPLINHPQVLGLAEMMNFPGVIYRQKDVLEKIILAQSKIIDGHCPSLTGEALCAYISAGITSEHEAVTLKDAQEKLSKGMYIMIREGSSAKNLENLTGLIKPETFRRLMFVSDDRHPHDLLSGGHIDFIIRKAISLGISPFIAISMASFNPAQYFGLRRRGAVACGFVADMVTFKNLAKPEIDMVFKNGELVARGSELVKKTALVFPVIKKEAMKINPSEIKTGNFHIPAKGKKVRVIEIVPNQIVTNAIIAVAKIENGAAVPNIKEDIIKIAVMERYSGEMAKATGFIKGLGIKEGAIASSVAHDSHNLIGVGTNDNDLAKAFSFLASRGGGLCCVKNDRVLAHLDLPIAGLMSSKKASVVAGEMEKLVKAAHTLGSHLENPFMALSFLALPVIPHLKITDKGLFNVDEFKFVNLFVE